MLEIEVTFTAEGHKSSEGDGRTAADIEREILERRIQEEKREEIPSQEETD